MQCSIESWAGIDVSMHLHSNVIRVEKIAEVIGYLYRFRNFEKHPFLNREFLRTLVIVNKHEPRLVSPGEKQLP